MPSNPISLAEAVQIIEEGNIEDVRLLEFAKHVEHIGTDILRGQSDKTLADMVVLLQSAALTTLVADGKMDVQDFLMICIDPKFLFFTSAIMKLSFGLAASEELR